MQLVENQMCLQFRLKAILLKPLMNQKLLSSNIIRNCGEILAPLFILLCHLNKPTIQRSLEQATLREVGCHSGELNDMIRCEPFPPIEKSTPIDMKSPLLPVGSSRNSERNGMIRCEPFPPIEKSTPIDMKSPLLPVGSSRNSELQYEHGDIFSRKRIKLLQLAAGVLSLEIDELYSKGSDLVSELLQRLGIERNANNSLAFSRSMGVKLNINSQLHSSPDLDFHSEELLQTQRSNLMASSGRHHVEESFPELWCKEADKPNLSSLLCSEDLLSLSTWHAHEKGLEYEDRQFDYVRDCGRTTFDINSGTEFSFNKYGYFTLGNTLAKLDCLAHKNLPSCWHSPEHSLIPHNNSELGDIYHPNAIELAREQCNLQLLGWNDNMENAHELPIANDSTVNPAIAGPISLEDDYWRNFNRRVGAIALCSPVGRYILDKGHYPSEKSDNFPPILSCTQNYLSLTKDTVLSNNYDVNNLFPSLPCSSFISGVFQEKLHPSFDPILLSSGFDFQFRRKSLSSPDFYSKQDSPTHLNLQFHENKIRDITSFGRSGLMFDGCTEKSSNTELQSQFDAGILNTHNISPFGFNFSSNKDSVWPLLLDRSNWCEFEGEISSDQSDKDSVWPLLLDRSNWCEFEGEISSDQSENKYN
ncbi:uncharacterized protein LOC143892180 isoform X2 [Tasmannia lanceolata]|uniref:uncharacterized protein LOC143892180 isoform X2 n=1 Tax=Tasmannia lanceolata TaxID=3420 RepID=UPI004063AC2A